MDISSGLASSWEEVLAYIDPLNMNFGNSFDCNQLLDEILFQSIANTDEIGITRNVCQRN